MTPDAGDSDVPPPPVPAERLVDWERTEAGVDRLFGVEGADVRGHTVVYEDRRLREAVHDATGLDRSWRFFFATRLSFRPPLGPGANAAILPTVRSQAVRSFCADLEDRGVRDVERGRSEHIRTETDTRVRLRQVTGVVPLSDPKTDEIDDAVPIEGWVGVWHDGDFFVAGGAYPRTSLARTLDAEDDRLSLSPSEARDELLDLVRAVGGER